jgi:hypothetical protein
LLTPHATNGTSSENPGTSVTRGKADAPLGRSPPRGTAHKKLDARPVSRLTEPTVDNLQPTATRVHQVSSHEGNRHRRTYIIGRLHLALAIAHLEQCVSLGGSTRSILRQGTARARTAAASRSVRKPNLDGPAMIN